MHAVLQDSRSALSVSTLQHTTTHSKDIAPLLELLTYFKISSILNFYMYPYFLDVIVINHHKHA